MRSRWTLAGGLRLCRQIEKRLAPHWHVALAGGVLLRGVSVHDLDVIIYPHRVARGTVRMPFAVALRACGMRLVVDKATVQHHWRKLGSKDTKHVEVWIDSRRRRVDVIVLA